MFKKILIANRGEIACRVAAAARGLGVKTVAVYSDADAGAAHAASADEAVHIGPAPAAESYLHAGRIIEAAQKTGAEAVHPGYGFLSENPDFAEAVEAAGLVFIGPPAAAIRAMGLKDAAKTLMESAGVPVTPGYHGENQNADFLAEQAGRIGYPVLIKACAGGGGKGMRRVDGPEDFSAALAAARNEAEKIFSDGRVLIETYVRRPRHIEIQIIGDKHGNTAHLMERDCSLQRRHQKVIEESPAPGMTPETRAAMGRAAVEAAKAVGYHGAGTVEFIADASAGLRPDGFWFMEMNTRLQVEHPVTEAVTGLDLAALQIRIAAGEPLPFSQADVAVSGHAFEARLYAEDPAKGFLPAGGTLKTLRFPPGARTFAPGDVRVDSGVREGDKITPHYDPMIAKIIAHGPDRAAALSRLAAALDDTRAEGCVTNLAFLRALCAHPGFAAGDVDTGLIERDAGMLLRPPAPQTDAVWTDPWKKLRGWRAWGRAMTLAPLDVSAFDAEDTGGADGAGADIITAPMTGAVTAVEVRAGDKVARGQTMIVMEAMKMTHELRAPRDGVVAEVAAEAGGQAGDGDVLARLEPSDG
ncbi:MAG: acetyl/propionyl/methylcrotonyl-CoA carboxylase subunit alpha [Rhodospirillales bacterium]